jgi:hypothetical protein
MYIYNQFPTWQTMYTILKFITSIETVHIEGPATTPVGGGKEGYAISRPGHVT